MDSREYMRPDGHCKVCGWFHCRCAPAEVVECAGPFVSAFDCPVCDPRKRPIGPTSAVEAAAPGGEMTWQSAAQRLGEELASSGPAGYYSMTPEQWLAWSLAALRPVPAPGGDALREALQGIEWAGEWVVGMDGRHVRSCPACGDGRPNHTPACWLAAALRAHGHEGGTMSGEVEDLI